MKWLRMIVLSLLAGVSVVYGERPSLDWQAYRQTTADEASLFVVDSQFLIDAMAAVSKTVEAAVSEQHKVIGCGLRYDSVAEQMRFFCEVVYLTELKQTRYRVFEFSCAKTLLLERQTDKKQYWRSAATPPFQRCVDLRTCPLQRGVALFEKTLREQNDVPSLVAIYAIPQKASIKWCFYGGQRWGEKPQEMGLGGDYNLFLDKSMRNVLQFLRGK